VQTDLQHGLFELCQLLSQAAVSTNMHLTSRAQHSEIRHTPMFKRQSCDVLVCMIDQLSNSILNKSDLIYQLVYFKVGILHTA